MRPLQRVEALAIVGLACLVSIPCARAEDTKGKWQFGFGMSYYSTVDYIRSNADLAIASGSIGENGLPSVGSVDERPDINIMNQASIHDDFMLDFRGSYGLTRWLALEAGVSYMSAPVGNIEFYNNNVDQEISSPTDTVVRQVSPACGPNASTLSDCWEWTPQSPNAVKHNTFLPVGTITEIPVQLSGLVRFRPESPLNPYIGLGFGYIIADLKHGDEFNQAASVFSDPNFIVSSADEGEYTINNRCRRENGASCNSFHPGPLEANVNNHWEWHAIGGVDYHTSDHFAFFVDARYVWTQGAVDIRTDDAHQVRFAINDPGTLLLQTQAAPGKTFNANDPSTWYLWEDIGVAANQHFHDLCPQCQNDGFLETEDLNLNGVLDPSESTAGILYKIPPGTRAITESIQIPCPQCAQVNVINGVSYDDLHTLNTEDTNGNGYLDRYLVYGVDICSTDQRGTDPRCSVTGRSSPTVRYVWPEGCSQSPATLAPFATLTENGCPPFLKPTASTGPNGQPILTYPSVAGTGTDNSADTYIVQGGKIRMGGFALGLGIKFTF